MTTPDLQSTLDAIDAATGCQQCGGPLGKSPSDDFCGEFCQDRWRRQRAVPLAPPLRSPHITLHIEEDEFLRATERLAAAFRELRENIDDGSYP